MPLLDILGSTSLNHTFFIGFVFLSGETEEDYSSALKILHEIMNIQEITFPNVIVTDKDQGLMNAICSIFPLSYNLLYDWHINKNVLSYSHELKIYEKESEDEDAFMTQWQVLVSSKTVEDYKKSWREFQIQWQECP